VNEMKKQIRLPTGWWIDEDEIPSCLGKCCRVGAITIFFFIPIKFYRLPDPECPYALACIEAYNENQRRKKCDGSSRSK